MCRKDGFGIALAGLAAGSVTGMLGAGGGMLLIPLLGMLTCLPEKSLFPVSLSIMVPICVVSLMAGTGTVISIAEILPYLLGSAVGGLAAGLWGGGIPAQWLHRGLGLVIAWGGVRLLW